MRLSELATVSNFERLKPPFVGVTADSAIRLFFCFFGLMQAGQVTLSDGLKLKLKLELMLMLMLERKVCWLERVEGFDELNSLTLSTGLILT